MIKIILIIMGFIAGLAFCIKYNSRDLIEGFDGFARDDCPNILVQKGGRIELRNTKKLEVPGVNPIYFENLEEYKEFIEWQRANGIKCPILAFKEMQTADGKSAYKVCKELSSNDMKEVPLYDASRDDPPFNKNSYPGFDENDQNIGRNTVLDRMDRANNIINGDDDWNTIYEGRDIGKNKFKNDSSSKNAMNRKKWNTADPFDNQRAVADNANQQNNENSVSTEAKDPDVQPNPMQDPSDDDVQATTQ